MNDELYISIRDDDKRVIFFLSNSFEKNLYNNLYFEKIQDHKLLLLYQSIHNDYNVLIISIISLINKQRSDEINGDVFLIFI